MKNVFFSLLLSGFFLNSLVSLGSQRKVYFSVVGQNQVKTSLAQPAQSTCTVAATNTSAVTQLVTINLSQSTATPGTATPEAVSQQTALPGATVKSSVTYSPLSSAADQTVTCAGSVIVDDQTTPGFVSANGTLVTFFESGVQQTQNATGSSTYGTQAVFSQIPVPINGGKPF